MLIFGLVGSYGLNPTPARAASGSDNNQIIVQLVPGANINLVNMLLGTTLVRALNLDQTYLLTVPLGQTVGAVIGLLQINPLVVFAEPNYKMFATEAQQAFIYYDQGSGLQNGSSAPSAVNQARHQWAWGQIELAPSQNLSQGQGVTVATLDTGVNPNHPAIKNQLVPGYNAFNQNADVNDDSGHGTFVAGVIAQVAPQSTIMPVKVLNSQGQGTVADASDGLVWATNHNARVINMSLGLYTSSILLGLCVKYAQDRGTLVVASAGNSNTTAKRYPAAYPNVIGVAATDQNDQKASFSNYGDNARVSAPGVGIYSAYYTGGYAYGDGTSFSAPQVAGLAAQVWARNPASTTGFVSGQIVNNAVSLVNKDPVYGSLMGSGRIDNYYSIINS